MINAIIEFSAKNRFVVFLLVAVAVVAGVWSMKTVPLDAIPDLSDTQVIVYSRWDRSPDIVEDQLTYPLSVSLQGLAGVKTVRASYADYIWGIPEEVDSLYPNPILSTRPIDNGKALQVLTPERGSLADRAGFKENDVLVSLDGAPVPDKETLNRLIAAKRWGDVAVYVVRRGTGTQTLTMLFRRTPATK